MKEAKNPIPDKRDLVNFSWFAQSITGMLLRIAINPHSGNEVSNLLQHVRNVLSPAKLAENGILLLTSGRRRDIILGSQDLNWLLLKLHGATPPAQKGGLHVNHVAVPVYEALRGFLESFRPTTHARVT